MLRNEIIFELLDRIDETNLHIAGNGSLVRVRDLLDHPESASGNIAAWVVAVSQRWTSLPMEGGVVEELNLPLLASQALGLSQDAFEERFEYKPVGVVREELNRLLLGIPAAA